MRPRFERALEDYGELAKDELAQADAAPAKQRAEPGESTEATLDAETVARALEYRIRKAAETMGTTEQKQRRIYEFQKQKQGVMRDLKEQLRCLDDAECTPEVESGARPVRLKSDRYLCTFTKPDGTGEDRELTLGDIFTDGEWGVRYHLDPETVPRNVRKRYITEAAKRELRRLTNWQIVLGERVSTGTHVREGRVERGETIDAGFVAEKLMLTFLQKLAHDHGVDVEAEPADEYEDAVQKIDFLIERLSHRRGARVEKDPRLQAIGVQFTIGAGKGKARQVEEARSTLADADRGTRVDDIVLVRVNAPDLERAHAQWIAEGRPPGGPAREWVEQHRWKLLHGLLQRMYAPEELKEIAQRIGVPMAEPTVPVRAIRTITELRTATESQEVPRGGHLSTLIRTCGRVAYRCWDRLSELLDVPAHTIRQWARQSKLPQKEKKRERIVRAIRTVADEQSPPPQRDRDARNERRAA